MLLIYSASGLRLQGIYVVTDKGLNFQMLLELVGEQFTISMPQPKRGES
ncbi:hypothetical protein NTGM5_80007 [Candidatus Nitrotoga sp. M5]|nr:hypothetical protein NTGM5_80007 [Candidatus Nitrotoga sp. M5]